MLRRPARAACAVLATAALALTALQGTAGAAAPNPGSAAAVRAAASAAASAPDTLAAAAAVPEVLDALRRDLGLTAGQAQARIVNEARAGARAGALAQGLGAAWAGSWVEGADAAGLAVATTRAADAATIRAAGARPVVVAHPLAALDGALAALDRAAERGATGRADALAAPVRFVDVRTNTVVVQATDPAAAERLVAAAGVDRAAVRVERVAEAPRPLYDLRGGDAYYIGGSSRCSIGFPITRGTTQGFVSAGHCGRAGSTTTGSNRVSQGSFQASVFPGNDMSWVAANSSWTATPYVNSASGAVSGSVLQQVGASVCRSGSTTGWHCGTIQQHGTSVTYQEGTVSGVTRTNVCAEPGDSGGSFISGTQAQGVTSGGTGNCSQGGTTYFQPVNPILQGYGLTLKTDSQGPGPGPGPGNPGGTWAAGTVYQAGDTVTYGSTSYRCLQGHQAQAGWEPPNAPALWQAA
ncbi:carbohydrate-binding protein [Kitasatospora sp. NPDC057692]|uniref:carbohydrate-binding protein n=1 Tax=Kitasatospora sp. NPDC057692 TaxID=3346215 RepID=UPI0036754921